MCTRIISGKNDFSRLCSKKGALRREECSVNVRMRGLPAGWYPESEVETRRVLDSWNRSCSPARRSAVAGVVPHAGWFFSGRLAYSVLCCVDPGVDAVVIVGGHLPERDRVLIITEAAAETPLGPIKTHEPLARAVADEFDAGGDSSVDNTVEVNLPIVKYVAPDARFVGVRVSPTKLSLSLGSFIGEWAERTGEKIAVIGSTDLTHYGPAYGFGGHGVGEEAVEWATDSNDRIFIERLLAGDFEGALAWANDRRAACSAGGAVAAGAFAETCGGGRGRLIEHTTSYRRSRSDSFVGYASIVYENSRTTQSQ